MSPKAQCRDLWMSRPRPRNQGSWSRSRTGWRTPRPQNRRSRYRSQTVRPRAQPCLWGLLCKIFYRPDAFQSPTQQCQSTEGINTGWKLIINIIII